MDLRGQIGVMQFGLDYFITVKANPDMFEKIEQLKEKDCDIIIKEHKEQRSLNANAYFHKLCNEIAKKTNRGDSDIKAQMNTEYGTIATRDGQVFSVTVPKDVNINEFYPYTRWIKDSSDGKFSAYIFYKPTHELDTAEMSKLIEGTQNEAKDLGIETLDEIKLKELMKAYEYEINNSRR